MYTALLYRGNIGWVLARTVPYRISTKRGALQHERSSRPAFSGLKMAAPIQFLPIFEGPQLEVTVAEYFRLVKELATKVFCYGYS